MVTAASARRVWGGLPTQPRLRLPKGGGGEAADSAAAVITPSLVGAAAHSATASSSHRAVGGGRFAVLPSLPLPRGGGGRLPNLPRLPLPRGAGGGPASLSDGRAQTSRGGLPTPPRLHLSRGAEGGAESSAAVVSTPRCRGTASHFATVLSAYPAVQGSGCPLCLACLCPEVGGGACPVGHGFFRLAVRAGAATFAASALAPPCGGRLPSPPRLHQPRKCRGGASRSRAAAIAPL